MVKLWLMRVYILCYIWSLIYIVGQVMHIIFHEPQESAIKNIRENISDGCQLHLFGSFMSFESDYIINLPILYSFALILDCIVQS